MRTPTRFPGFSRAPIAILALSLAAVGGLVALSSDHDASASDSTPVTVISSDFEDGTTQNWTSRSGTEVVANSTDVAHGGTSSLAVTERANTWHGPTLDVLDTMELGVTYTITVYVQLASGESSDSARLSLERQLDGTASYETIVSNTSIYEGTWTKLSGTYTLANDVDFLTVYVETANAYPSFYIDDFTMTYVAATPIQDDILSLQDHYADDFVFGTAVSLASLLAENGELVAKHFNSLTAGNAMKWDATEGTEGTFTYSDADAIVEFAEANGMQVRGHTLVWHNQTPDWVFLDADGNTMTATEENKELLLSRLENHIRNVVEHFGDSVGTWDVVNEVIDESQSGGLRQSMWYTITGLDYLRTAFTVAREVAPSATLCINDYNTTVSTKRDYLYDLVSQLIDEGVPIDCVGHQMHGNVDWPSASDTEAAISMFADLGVTQQITEMDISVYTDSSSSYTSISDELLTKQAARYDALFDVFLSHTSDISSVTVWGVTDDESWLNTYPISRLDAPLLFDADHQAKPVYWTLTNQTSPTASATGDTTTSASASASSESASATASATASSSTTSSSSANASASASTSQAPSSCSVTYSVAGEWNGGFQGTVVLANTGSSAIDGWTLEWSFADGQQLTQLWNGSYTQSGSTVTVTNASWNGALAAGGGSATFGFLSSWADTNSVPTGFTLNGATCG